MDLLTTSDVQALIKVDRSTIYRMAESGRLPAIKVGRQWRFPADQIDEWLGRAGAGPAASRFALAGVVASVADMLASATGVMVMVTDMEGRALAPASRPNGLFEAIADTPALDVCVAGWRDLADDAGMEPRFLPTPLGFECARSFFRAGATLKGMVIAGGIAPAHWPPTEWEVEQMAAHLGVAAPLLEQHINEVFVIDEDRRRRVLKLLPASARVLSEVIKTDRSPN